MTTKKNKKPSSLLFNFYIFLGALQAIIILGWVLALMVWLPNLSDTTASGAGLVLGLIYPLFLTLTCVAAVIDLVGLSVYMFRHGLKGTRRVLGIITLAVSLIPVGFGIFFAYQVMVVAPAEHQRFEQEREERERERTEQERREIQEIEQYRMHLDRQGSSN